MRKIIDLLRRCEMILVNAKAPKSDIKALRSLTDTLSTLNISANEFNNYLSAYGVTSTKAVEKKTAKAGKYRSPSNIDKVCEAYRKQAIGNSITTDESQIIFKFESKHPNVRPLVLCKINNLYDNISKIGEKEWSIEELRLLLLFHFDIKPVQNTSKMEMLSQLKNNTYNINYMDSMKSHYEGKSEPK